MAKIEIKAKKTFASGKQIFYPYSKDVYEVEEELAAAWEKSGHCIIVKNGPILSDEPIGDTKVSQDEKNAENGQDGAKNNMFEAMDYKELKAAAKKAKIKGYNTMKQKDLIKALKGE